MCMYMEFSVIPSEYLFIPENLSINNSLLMITKVNL